MFKAIGKWGSQVKNTLHVHIFSNIFGSKSKKYGDLNEDEKEIFCDAQEEISDSESDTEAVQTTSVETNGDITVKADIDWTPLLVIASDSETTTTDETTQEDVLSETRTEENSESGVTIENLVTFDVENETEENAHDVTDTKEEENTGSDSGSSGESDGDDDHHVNHSDKKKIMKNSKSSNGLVQSASATVIQKVHRRVNSYSQRQYAKFDNAHDDENNVIQDDDAITSNDDVDNDDIDKIDQIDSKTEKKKRKKKIAKKTRKAVRRTWKWFRRSMVAYATSFNFPAMFATNVASSTRK